MAAHFPRASSAHAAGRATRRRAEELPDGGMRTVMLASVTSFIDQHSQWALLAMFVLLLLESFGLPLPGETALIACSVLASQGVFSIVSVIAVAVAAAITVDNLGY